MRRRGLIFLLILSQLFLLQIFTRAQKKSITAENRSAKFRERLLPSPCSLSRRHLVTDPGPAEEGRGPRSG